MGTGCLFREVRGAGAGDATEDGEVCNRVTAKTVVAVDTAGDFTRGEEAGDHIAVGVDHFGVVIDLNAAHRVMDAG